VEQPSERGETKPFAPSILVTYHNFDRCLEKVHILLIYQ
jgi:hypothetical protein